MNRVAYELERPESTIASGVFSVLSAPFPADTPYALPVDWSPLPAGATSVDITDASFFIAPRADDTSVPAVTVSPSNAGTFMLTLPQGLRVRALTLSDLGIGSGDAFVSLASEADLNAHDPPLRLTVALPDPRGGFGAPSYAVPPVWGSDGVTPNSLTGASFAGGVLTLPEVAAAKLRIALVTGDPGAFVAAGEVSLSKVAADTARYPAGLALSSAGTTLWSFPRELPPHSATQLVDFKIGLKKLLLDKLKANAAPSVTLNLTASGSAAVTLSGLNIHGALVRAFPGALRTKLEGNAAPLALPKPGEPVLALDDSLRITADVTVKYDGIRLVSELSDDVPAGACAGVIVAAGADAVRAALPAEALKGQVLARIGLVGRAPEDCELSVRLVKPLTGEPLPGDPAVVRLARADVMGVVWLALPTPAELSQPIAIAARTTRGRFFWASRDDARPRVQIAIADPHPPERTVRLGGRVIASDLTPAQRSAVDLTGCFVEGPPRFESAMFVTVDLSNVTARYAR